MIISIGHFVMVSTRKSRQQNKKLLSHLIESDTGQKNHEAQVESGVNTMEESITSNNANDP